MIAIDGLVTGPVCQTGQAFFIGEESFSYYRAVGKDKLSNSTLFFLLLVYLSNQIVLK